MSNEELPAAVGARIEPGVRPLVPKLREAAAQAGHYGAWGGGVLLDQAADEIEQLREKYNELLYAVGKKHTDEKKASDDTFRPRLQAVVKQCVTLLAKIDLESSEKKRVLQTEGARGLWRG